MLYLKQSTASQNVLIGPFVDDTDGASIESGLTIANTDIRLSKNGANIAAKNSGGGTHDELGMYQITLDATDTDTVGRLQLIVNMSGALIVYHEFWVLEEAAYDDLFGASAPGIPTAAEIVNEWETQSQADPTGFHVNVKEVNGTAQTANDIGGDVDAILADTNELQTDDVPGLIAALNDLTAAEVNAEVDTALADYDGPTKAELDSGFAALNDPTAAGIADAVWDEAMSGHTTVGTYGQRLQALDTGTAQAGATASITLRSGASANDDEFNGMYVLLTGGTGAGQLRIVRNYTGSTKVADVIPNWITTPDSSSEYVIVPAAWSIFAGYKFPQAGSDSAVEYTLSDLLSVSVNQLSGSSSAANNLTDDYDGTGYAKANSSIGEATALGTQAKADVNAEVDSAIETYHLDHLLAATYDPASKPGASDALLNEIIENDGGVSRFTENALEQAPSGTGASAATIADAVWDEDRADHTTAGTFGEGVKAEALNTQAKNDVNAEADTALSDYDPPTKAELDSGLAGLNDPTADSIADAVLDEALSGHTTAGTLGKAVADIESDATAILVDTGTTLQGELDGIQADTEDIQSRLPAALVGGRIDATVDGTGMEAAAVDAILDEVVEGSITLREFIRGMGAALLGELSGAATTTITIRDASDTKTRITATVDADGNRSALTLDLD